MLHPTIDSVAVKQNDLLIQAEQGPLQARDISFTLRQLTGDVATCGSRCRVQIQVHFAVSIGGAQVCRDLRSDQSLLAAPATARSLWYFECQQFSLLPLQQTLPPVSQRT